MAGYDNITGQQTSIPASGGNTGISANFIPEIWSDEVIADYEDTLVLAPLVKKMSMKGKKGDTIHVPNPGRSSANAKVADTSITLNSDTASELVILIDKHFEYSRMIEDLAEVQALSSMRRFYTQDAGYALASQTDTDIGNTAQYWQGGSGSDWTAGKFWDATNGWSDYAVDTVQNVDVFTDAFLRRALQELDDNNTPMSGRYLAIPPSLCNTMRGIDRYVSSDFRDNRVVGNGMIGTVYDVPVYVSTNVPVVETAAANSAGDAVRGALLAHRDASILCEQQGVRSQVQYKQEHLSTLYTADRIYGVSPYQDTSGIVLCVPDNPDEG